MQKTWVGFFICFTLAFASVFAPRSSAAGWEIDETGTVSRIIEGDIFDASPVGRVRLADVNAPKVGEPGSVQATDFLASKVLNQRVYLDVDDVSRTDLYGRLVCVVYVRHNATHLLNVNKALLDAGLADAVDFANEFDPTTWTPYVYFPGAASSQTYDIVWLVAAVASASAGVGLTYMFVRRRKGRSS